jgi:serine/threonine protein kinase
MNFIELEKLGSGAFGHVWKAYNRIDARQYAVKKIAFPNANDPNNIRAFNEVRCLAELEHKNIARYYTAWLELSDLPLADEDEDEDEDEDDSEDDDRPMTTCVYPVMYIQMELCTTNLREYLMARNYSGKVSDMTLEKQMIRGLIDGLWCIHQHGILHRDLTPKNIFLNGQMIPKIGDFGMAIRDNQVTNPVPSDFGVALYRPPEDEYTRKSDVYSMGLIFFEILSYFQTDMERYKVLDNLRKGLYPKNDFPTYIYQMIQIDPDLRPEGDTMLGTA